MKIATSVAKSFEATASGLCQSSIGLVGSAEHRQFQRVAAHFFGKPIKISDVCDETNEPQNPVLLNGLRGWSARRRIRLEILELRDFVLEGEQFQVLLLTDNLGARTWLRIDDMSLVRNKLKEISLFRGQKLWIVPSGRVGEFVRNEGDYFQKYYSLFEIFDQGLKPRTYQSALKFLPSQRSPASKSLIPQSDSHLRELESESIEIFREAVASGKKTCMLFSMGKDSMVMLWLASKAFAPGKLPFPIVLIDSGWEFQEVYKFKNFIASQPGIELISFSNLDALEQGINPFDFDSATYTQLTRTDALKQVLDLHSFEMIFGGGRRDEEKSRAKERIFSVRQTGHTWNPREQRPELWNLYNVSLQEAQTMRVFPLSNWTELDVWKYIDYEQIPVAPLYFAKRRAVVKRNGAILQVDDSRMRLGPDEKIEFEICRFRTLGCYPLTGASISPASSTAEIVKEIENTSTSERSSRVIDFDPGASMEQKKREGYF